MNRNNIYKNDKDNKQKENATKNLKKNKVKKKKLDSHDLVRKSLKEVSSLYRTSAFIEICIFLLIELILATYYLSEINVLELYEKNSLIKNERLKFNKSVLDDLQSIEFDNRINRIIDKTFDLSYYKVIELKKKNLKNRINKTIILFKIVVIY